jgi:hypothetical protein
MRAPLYAVTAGQMGFDAGTLENNLKTVLDLSTRWDAVLLLDEGDVLLERRSTHELHRNRLVSSMFGPFPPLVFPFSFEELSHSLTTKPLVPVFLQQLEYYAGAMIITTNRARVIDDAIQSRIHIKINLPGLSLTAKRSLWSAFLDTNKIDHALTEDDLEGLAKADLNGREIKNLLRSAVLMARKERAPLALSHVQVVLDILLTSKMDMAEADC